MKLKTYKDFDIEVDSIGRFYADGIDGRFYTYSELELKIDKESKLKYKPVDGYYVSLNEIFGVSIQRPAPSYGTGKRFWIKKPNGKRETSGSCYPKCGDTDRLIDSMLVAFDVRKKIEIEIIYARLADYRDAIELQLIK